MSYTDEQLNNIQNNIMNEMKKEDDLDLQIKEASISIAKNLERTKKCKVDWNNKQLSIVCKIDESTRVIFLIIIDEIKYKIAGANQYKPLILTYESQNELSLIENLTAAIEAYLYHSVNRTKVEDLGHDSTYRIERGEKR